MVLQASANVFSVCACVRAYVRAMGVRHSALVLCAYMRECLCTQYLDIFVSV